jgi:signal transduction histidine kinase
VMSRIGGQYALAVVGVTLVALGVGWLVATRALAPLRAIARTAHEVSGDRLDTRIVLDGPRDELHELGATLNAMLERLEESAQARRRFVASAGHELRTPLTVIRTEAEVALDDPHATPEELRAMGRAVLETSERMEGLLDGLLVLAAGERGVGGGRFREPVDLAAVTRRAVAATPGVRFDARITPAAVSGDEPLLARVVENLLENAVRHNRPGGAAQVTLGADDRVATLRVVNDGPPVPPEAVARLTEPFERLDRSNGGYGLGLSIVRAVTEAHGGELHLRAREDGGLEAEVRLPALTEA